MGTQRRKSFLWGIFFTITVVTPWAPVSAQADDLSLLSELIQVGITDPVTQAQKLALGSLGDLSDPSALQIAGNIVLGDPDIGLRQYAAYALAQQGGVQDLAFLSQALSDPDPLVRRMILLSLGTMGQIALPSIAVATSDPDPSVAATAQQLISRSM